MPRPLAARRFISTWPCAADSAGLVLGEAQTDGYKFYSNRRKTDAQRRG